MRCLRRGAGFWFSRSQLVKMLNSNFQRMWSAGKEISRLCSGSPIHFIYPTNGGGSEASRTSFAPGVTTTMHMRAPHADKALREVVEFATLGAENVKNAKFANFIRDTNRFCLDYNRLRPGAREIWGNSEVHMPVKRAVRTGIGFRENEYKR